MTCHMMRTSRDSQHAPSTCQETQVGAVKFKNGMRKWFCKDICGIVCTRNVRKKKVFGKNMRVNKMKTDIYMFCVIMRDTIICKCDGAFVVRLN